MAYIGRDIQYGTLDKQSFTANSSTTSFSLDSSVLNAKSLLVSVGGVIQEPEVAYTASGSTLTFTEAPATGNSVYAVYLGKSLEISEGRQSISYQTGTGDGTTTPLTLNASPANAQSIIVALDGIVQTPVASYSVSGTTLTFGAAPATGVKITVYHMGQTAAIGTIANNSVTDAKITSMNASKLTGTLPASMAVDTTSLDQSIAALGLHVASSDNKVAFNLANSFIDQFEDDSGILTETTVDRNTTGEYVSSVDEVYGSPVALTKDSIAGDTITFHVSNVTANATRTAGTVYQLDDQIFTWSGYPNRFFESPVGQMSSQTWYWSSPSTSTTPGASSGWTVDYASKLRFTSFMIHRNCSAAEVMSFRLQYSDDNTNWTNFDLTGSTFSASAELTAASMPDNVWANSTKDNSGVFSTTTATSSGKMSGSIWTPATPFEARYIRFDLLTWANRGNNNVGWGQFRPTVQAKTTQTSATGTLISKAQTADAAVSSTSGVMLYEDSEGTGTLGTDLKVYFSSNDGTNWTETASYGSPLTFSGSKKMVKLGKTTIANTGTAVKMKAEWANQVAGQAGTTSMVAQGTGTIFGDFTTGVAIGNAFDGTQNAASGASPSSNGTSGYIGKNWGSGNGKTISGVKIWAATNTGYINNNSHTFDIRLYGSNTAPTNATDGTLVGTIASGTTSPYSGDPRELMSGITATQYQYIWVAFIAGQYVDMYLAEVEFYETSTPVAGKVQRLHGWAVNY